MKKISFSLVIVALLLLTACGGQKAAGGTSGAPVKITYMEWGDPAELDVWKAIVSDFEAANPNITVDVQVSDWDSYWTKLKTLLAANSASTAAAHTHTRCSPLDALSRGLLGPAVAELVNTLRLHAGGLGGMAGVLRGVELLVLQEPLVLLVQLAQPVLLV